MSKFETELADISKTLFGYLDPDAKISIEMRDQGSWVNIESSLAQHLIGYHGKRLEAINAIVNLILYQKTSNWQEVVIDVNGYIKNKQETLQKLALKLAQRAKFSNKPQIVSDLSSHERKIIHLTLLNHPEVTTNSVGEQKDRKLVVSLK